MKNLTISALTFIFILFSYVSLQAETGNDNKDESKINWVSVDEMQKLNKAEPRKVFFDVYTDWCTWCKRMDVATFQDQEIVEYVNKNYYAVKLDAESDKKVTFNNTTLTERELARAFRVSGYPTVVLIDEKLTTIMPVPGFQKPDAFKKILVQFNKESVQ